MSMIFLAITLAILAASGVAAAPARQFDVSRCPESPNAHLARPGAPVRPHKLVDLPAGKAFAAVYRRDERGCMIPVLYSERYRPPVQRKPRP
jgi:hypothetical protein